MARTRQTARIAELSDQINTMIQQEVSAYSTVNYLTPSYQQRLRLSCYDASSSSLSSPRTSSVSVEKNPPCAGLEEAEQSSLAASAAAAEAASKSSSSSSRSPSSASLGINEMWREKICEWCYQVIDHFDFSREVAAITMNYLDRYLATKIVNKKVFQLAAMTALFLAVKIHEPAKLTMSSMIELSRGSFNEQQMVAMEISLLRGLRWHLHPPTAHSFTKRFLHLVPVSPLVPVNVLYDILELSRFLAELSVVDFFFVTQLPSHVAVAAIANAMQDIGAVPPQALRDFWESLQQHYQIDYANTPQIMECRKRLRLLCALQGAMGPCSSGNSNTTRETIAVDDNEVAQRTSYTSPMSVAEFDSALHETNKKGLSNDTSIPEEQQQQENDSFPDANPAEAHPVMQVDRQGNASSSQQRDDPNEASSATSTRSNWIVPDDSPK